MTKTNQHQQKKVNRIFRFKNKNHCLHFDILVRFDLGTDVTVSMPNYNFTAALIKTNAVSTCHFILIDGKVDDKPFAYLSHSPFEFDSSNCNERDALIDLIMTITEHIIGEDGEEKKFPFNILKTKDLRLLVGGGEMGGVNLIRQGFALLNNTNFYHQFPDRSSQHLFNNLKNNVIIFPPITYLMPDDEENEGQYLTTIINLIFQRRKNFLLLYISDYYSKLFHRFISVYITNIIFSFNSN